MDTNRRRTWGGASIDTSVVVPCYNASDTIGELLDSLAGQVDPPAWELVIADNGSEDGTLDLVRAHCHRLPNVTIVDAARCTGASFARNEGVRNAVGDHIVFVDADDVAGAGWLAALRDAIPAHGLAASRFDGSVLNDAEARRLRSCPQQDGLMSFQYARFLPFASASGLAMRRDTFETLGGFDVSLRAGEDIDLCWRAQLEDRPLEFAADAVLHYRLRGESHEIARQVENYGFWTVPLYKRYRERGMERVPVREGLAAWAKLLAKTPRSVWRSESRSTWRKDFAYRWGLLKGSIAYRTVAL